MTRYTPQWLQAGTYPASLDRRLMQALWPVGACDGCAVGVSSGMTVTVAAGQIACPTANSTGVTLCTSDAQETVTLAAAPASGTNRYDLVICQPRGNDLDGGANNDFIFTSVTGSAAATPTVPATPANAVAVAQIYVPGGSASVVAGNIVDVRPDSLRAGPPQTWYGTNAGGVVLATTAPGTAHACLTATIPPGDYLIAAYTGGLSPLNTGNQIIAQIYRGTTATLLGQATDQRIQTPTGATGWAGMTCAAFSRMDPGGSVTFGVAGWSPAANCQLRPITMTVQRITAMN
jgi:hypothetical protein